MEEAQRNDPLEREPQRRARQAQLQQQQQQQLGLGSEADSMGGGSGSVQWPKDYTFKDYTFNAQGQGEVKVGES